MPSFFVVCYIISLAISVTTLTFGIFVGIKRFHTINILPRALRLYLITCGYPYFFLASVCSTFIACAYLLYNTQTHYTIEIVRNVNSFCSQQIRNAFTMIVIERIVATVKLENYTQANKINLFWKLTFISYTTSALYIAYTLYAKSMTDIPFLVNVITYYAYSAHLFMLSISALLYLMNRQIYKISAYQITLKKRYTIAQIIKSLSYLFPPILIYSLCAQFGSMISIIFQAFNWPTPPVAVYHIHYCIRSDNITTIQKVTTVKNPLGKNIPMNLTSDQYFQELKHQWK